MNYKKIFYIDSKKAKHKTKQHYSEQTILNKKDSFDNTTYNSKDKREEDKMMINYIEL